MTSLTTETYYHDRQEALVVTLVARRFLLSEYDF